MARTPIPFLSKSGQNRPATVKDIAQAAGVSATTVSNVLLDKAGNFSEKTAEQIRTLAKEMGYRRNSLARSLVTRHSDTLALLIEEDFDISNPENQYFVAFLQVFMRHATAAGQQVKLIQQSTPEGPNAISRIDDGSVDGVVGLVLSPENQVIDWLAGNTHLPSVLVGGEFKGSSPSTLDIEDRGSMAEVAAHLWTLGHRKVWYLTGKGVHPSLVERKKGFMSYYNERGHTLDSDCVFETDMIGRGGAEIVQAYLDTEESARPTAMACANDLVALGVLRAANKAGLKVPEDFSLTGFDGFPQGDWSIPSLTTVRQPFEQFGRRAAEVLLEKNGEPRRIFHEVFPGEFLARGSTAAV